MPTSIDWAGLRKPFPKSQVTQVDKGYGPLDTVNHAVVTSRLIADGGDWTYTVDERFTAGKSCWVLITLTVGGVSRPEYGEGDDPKKALSDALKRAAMRFGVALDLWAKAPLDDYEDPRPGLTPPVEQAAQTPEPISVETAAADSAPDWGAEPEEGSPEVLGEGAEGDPYLTKTEAGHLRTVLGPSGVKQARLRFGENIRRLEDLRRSQALEMLAGRVG